MKTTENQPMSLDPSHGPCVTHEMTEIHITSNVESRRSIIQSMKTLKTMELKINSNFRVNPCKKIRGRKQNFVQACVECVWGVRNIRVGQRQCAEACVRCVLKQRKSKLNRDSLPKLCAKHVF